MSKYTNKRPDNGQGVISKLEIIREKILLLYQKEVPYSCEVVVEEYKEDTDIIRIRANIMVSRKSQKSILIGHQGNKVKQLGIDSRKDMEEFVGKKVHLDLFVKVDEGWREINLVNLKCTGIE